MAMRAPSDFSVQELKKKLKSYGLSAAGAKAELINRLMQADLSGRKKISF